MTAHLLSLIIFCPLFFLIIVLLVPSNKNFSYKYIVSISSFIQLIFCGIIYYLFVKNSNIVSGINKENGFQFVEKLSWINLSLGSLGELSIEYFIGLDGLSVGMLLLASIVIFIGAISSWNIKSNAKGYFSLYLLLSSTIIGCFAALDLFLFYLFFELMLLPMYFLIGMWGGPRREYAAIKFFLYTLLGSVFILMVMIGLYLSVIDPGKTAENIYAYSKDASAVLSIDKVQQLLSEKKIESVNLVHTFNIIHMMDLKNYIPASILHISSLNILFGLPVRLLAFLALFIGFGIKLPIVPFHTWLPDAHVEAPTAISVVLAGILLKVGAYGILRIAYPIFPEGAIYFAWLIGLIGTISIIYAAFNALAMKDIKKMIAYSSVSHMGFVLLGLASLTAEGLNGSLFQMFSHGVLSSLLFLIAGVLYDRSHDRGIENYKGLASRMPLYTVIVTVAFFASLGLPGFSGFIGELFVLLGAFNSETVNGLLPRWMAMVSTLGLLLGAAYFLWTLQKMFFGRFWVNPSIAIKLENPITDLDKRELLMFIPIIGITIILGIFPSLLFDSTSASVAKLTDIVLQQGKINLGLINF